jgi:hypothetical protein
MATGLTTAEQTQIRSQLEAIFLPDTCTILTPVHPIGAAGGVTVTWGTAASNVACRLDSVRGQESLQGGGVKPYHTFVITLPTSATVTTANRILHSSINYNVTEVSKNGSWLLCKRATLEQVNG